MKLPVLQKRLLAAADCVRLGSFLADVGTDHAYLPVYLFGKGRIRGAVASDVNKKPLESAERHIAEYGFEKDLHTLLADGLDGVAAYFPDDITILGMGGELIARILSEAPFVKNKAIRLILQPMSRAEDLRSYLAGAGFAITDEILVAEGQRIYQIICATYDGVPRECRPIDALVGKQKSSPLFLRLLLQKQKVFQEILAGKEGSKPVEYERSLLDELEKMIEKESAQ